MKIFEAIKTFWTDDELNFPAHLQTIVSVIPASKFSTLKQEEIFMKQTMFANVILLNQTVVYLIVSHIGNK